MSIGIQREDHDEVIVRGEYGDTKVEVRYNSQGVSIVAKGLFPSSILLNRLQAEIVCECLIEALKEK